jgi:cold shock CspA family protein
MTGTITSLRGTRFGFIASDAYARPWHLISRRAAVAADGFDRLRAGQGVCFDQEATPGDPSRRHAARVAPLG